MDEFLKLYISNVNRFVYMSLVDLEAVKGAILRC